MAEMRKLYLSQDISRCIDRGWFPAWFAVEDGEFLIDLCANWRLQDGKVLFLKCTDHTPEFISGIAYQMKTLWGDEAAELEEKCFDG